MLIRILLAMAVFAGFSTSAAAQECQRSRAPTVTFAEAMVYPSVSRCVEMEGVMVGRVLVEDQRARYRREPVRSDPSSTGAVLGIYSDRSFDAPTRVRVVGKLTDCPSIDAAARARAEPDAIVMLTGYCHYYRGRVIVAHFVEPLGPAGFARLLPSEAGDDLGNLSPLAAGDTRERMLAAAQHFLTMVLTRDRAALAAAHGGGPDGRRAPAEVERVLQLLLADPGSPFAMLGNRENVTTEIFGWKPPLWADDAWHAEAARSGATDAIACFTGSTDAAAVWPIDSKDADNIPGRPYACTRIHIGSTGMDAPASFDTEQARSGVEEPIVILPLRDRVIHQP